MIMRCPVLTWTVMPSELPQELSMVGTHTALRVEAKVSMPCCAVWNFVSCRIYHGVEYSRRR